MVTKIKIKFSKEQIFCLAQLQDNEMDVYSLNNYGKRKHLINIRKLMNINRSCINSININFYVIYYVKFKTI